MRPAGVKRGKNRPSQVSSHVSAPWGRRNPLAGGWDLWLLAGCPHTRKVGGMRHLQSGVGSGHLCTDSLNVYRGRDNISCMVLNADSTIADLLREKPESAQVLFRFGMGCLGCAIANNETIREAAQAHGVPLEEMLSALGVAEA